MRVLITGAAGRIGRSLVSDLASAAGLQILASDVRPLGELPMGVDALDLDVRDADACRRVARAVDAIVHLAAHPDADADFATEVLPLNMLGTRNIAIAAVEAGCRRFVFASSAQAVEGYPAGYQIRESDPPVPANDYGVGKAFGEALCASLARRSSTSFVSVRIANYEPVAPGAEASLRDRAAWLSPRDANQLLRLAIVRDVPGSLVVHGASDNAMKRLSIEGTRHALGYAPVDDAFDVPLP